MSSTIKPSRCGTFEVSLSFLLRTHTADEIIVCVNARRAKIEVAAAAEIEIRRSDCPAIRRARRNRDPGERAISAISVTRFLHGLSRGGRGIYACTRGETTRPKRYARTHARMRSRSRSALRQVREGRHAAS